jgi:hypothetical protein
LIWPPKAATKRDRTSSGRLAVATTGQCKVAFELTLFTFWPPGPLLRANVKPTSANGMQICGVTSNTVGCTGPTRFSFQARVQRYV